MTTIDATDNAGPLLDFLRHAGGVVVSINQCCCRLVRYQWIGWEAISAVSELLYRVGVGVGLNTWLQGV